MNKNSSLASWILVSRIPFLTVSIMPFFLGSFMAFRIYGGFNWAVFIFSLLGIILIQLATHYNGEVYDTEEDILAAGMGRNVFTGGSQVIIQKKLEAKSVKLAADLCVIAALLIGLILQFIFRTGLWTIPLGLSGIIAGYFYSKPPFRWIKRGTGELLIAYGFGWLPVAAGFYVQGQHFLPILFWVSAPIAVTVFNIILINEFPDFIADRQAGKTNLLVRIGKLSGARLYLAMNFAAIVFFTISTLRGIPKRALIFYLPALILSVLNIVAIHKEGYKYRMLLERTCGFTILTNILTTLAYILTCI
jgi:1,4-dihydroxy-2-naphthoate octaprenyltransferase